MENYGKIRPLTAEEKKKFSSIISDFEKTTGAKLIQDCVSTMQDGDTNKIYGYHLLNKNADSSKPDNIISALLIVDKTGEKVRATIFGAYISSEKTKIKSISLKTKKLFIISESKDVHLIKYPTKPSVQDKEPEYQTRMISSPSISNLSHKDDHITGTIDVTVLGIFSWGVIGFDIDLKNREIEWWWIED